MTHIQKEIKSKPLSEVEIKQDDAGVVTIEGYASVFGNIDSYGDIVDRGAFAQSLQEHPEVNLCYAHDDDEIVGKTIYLAEDDYGLKFTARLLPTSRGNDVKVWLDEGMVGDFSIGYRTLESSDELIGGRPIRHLRRVELIEFSILRKGIAANPLATLTGVHKKHADWTAQLAEMTDSDLIRLKKRIEAECTNRILNRI